MRITDITEIESLEELVRTGGSLVNSVIQGVDIRESGIDRLLFHSSAGAPPPRLSSAPGPRSW